MNKMIELAQGIIALDIAILNNRSGNNSAMILRQAKLIAELRELQCR